jgi:tetratricopeptide (TPR) repeat protein
MVATVKSREIQRAMLAEMAGDRAAAARHFLAAAHLELVLAEDYAAAGAADMALRSRISAASCFWRAGQVSQAQAAFDELIRIYPASTAEIQRTVAELAQDYSAQAS